MADLNTVALVGRLVRDAEDSGRGPVRFDLAVNRRAKDGDEWHDEASFFPVEYWHRSLTPYLVKGARVGIVGELRQDRWTANDGSNRSRVIVIAGRIDLMGGPRREAEGNGYQGEGYPNQGEGRGRAERERPAPPVPQPSPTGRGEGETPPPPAPSLPSAPHEEGQGQAWRAWDGNATPEPRPDAPAARPASPAPAPRGEDFRDDLF